MIMRSFQSVSILALCVSFPVVFVELGTILCPEGVEASPSVLRGEEAERPEIVLVSVPSSGTAGEKIWVIEARHLPAEWLQRWKRQPPAPEQWRLLFPVRVAEGAGDRPALAGTYSMTASGVRFEPLYPLAAGHEYVAELRLSANHPAAVQVRLKIPAPDPGPRVRVVAVYPSAAVLPENTLRFYIHFSGEMSRGDVYRHFRLLREDGREVPHPFLELDEELWSHDGRRLTLLFHPGRVKRELVPREEEGPILEAGQRYTLLIRGDWTDIYGRPLAAEYRKTFLAVPAEESPVDPQQWKLQLPRAESRQPLLVRLPRPLDRALLERLVWLETETGQRLDLTPAVGGGEHLLTFTPLQPWCAGNYRLVVDTRLEDMCGNRVGRPFEVDLFGPITREIRIETVALPFTIR
ncbi:MAG: hypothetical protein WHU94_00660 [Thermogemmata sp.]|uniref:SbsA Ig-like domain-containing protein n=1 Tax=Thermogemmata fonticola TaxID=2755323 RepID=A0A7V8VG03_9BACT|nr:hypothetical protein [Thermogemmata fonticola]MBA2227261.1 hypothetical protein [Thermogemmata fonticola]MCX8138259.1 hypothetical protein [Gemmataceae bacterium]